MPNLKDNLQKNKYVLKILLLSVCIAVALCIAGCVGGEVVFSCSLTDGATVYNEQLTFTASAYIDGKTCHVQATANDVVLSPADDGTFTAPLVLGTNTIVVGTASGEISRTYTIVYRQRTFAIDTDINDSWIVNGVVTFNVTALCDGEQCSLVVLHDGTAVDKNADNGYSVKLAYGDNNFTFVAASGDDTYTTTATVYCGRFVINTNLTDVTTDKADYEFRARASYDGELCDVQAYINQSPIVANGVKYACTFDKSGDYTITLNAVHDKEKRAETYTVSYCDEPPYFDTMTLRDELVCKGNLYTFSISAKNGLGQKLDDNAITFAVDFDASDGVENFETATSSEISFVWHDAVKSSYRICFTAGRYKHALSKPTILRVTATYGKYTASQDYVITYIGPDSDGKIGSVTLSIEAFTISCGYILPPTKVDIYNGHGFAQYLCDIIKQHGWTYTNTGSIDDGFYLAQIGGLSLENNRIDKSLLEHMNNDGYKDLLNSIAPAADGKYNLGEFDFASGSGWMYSVNGEFPNYGFSDYYPQDGDVVRVQFTLCLGKDLGGSDAVGFGGKNYADNHPNYAKIHPFVADIVNNNYFGKSDELLNSVLNKVGKWNVEQKTIDDCIAELNKFYYGEMS